MSIAQQDTDTPDTHVYERRVVYLDDQSEVSVSARDTGACVSLGSPLLCVQTNTIMSREHLAKVRNAINAVLVATEPSA